MYSDATCWTTQEHVAVQPSEVNSASTVEMCKATCVDRDQCTSINFDDLTKSFPGQQCHLVQGNQGTESNSYSTTHYAYNCRNIGINEFTHLI